MSPESLKSLLQAHDPAAPVSPQVTAMTSEMVNRVADTPPSRGVAIGEQSRAAVLIAVAALAVLVVVGTGVLMTFDPDGQVTLDAADVPPSPAASSASTPDRPSADPTGVCTTATPPDADLDVAMYIVQEGDTLANVAQAIYGDASLQEPLVVANGLDPDSVLCVGDALVVPPNPKIDEGHGQQAPTPTPPPAAPSPSLDQLLGRWNLGAGEIDGIPVGVTTGGGLSLHIEFVQREQGPAVEAWWGCNPHSYRLVQSEAAVAFIGAGKTEVGCADGNAGEEVLDDAFRRTTNAVIEDGQLVLSGPAVVMRFTPAVTDPTQN